MHEYDIDNIVCGFMTIHTIFSMWYLDLPVMVYRINDLDCQHLNDKIVSKLVGWHSAGQTHHIGWEEHPSYGGANLQAIFHLTPLVFPRRTTNSIDKILTAFSWVEMDKVSGCKIK